MIYKFKTGTHIPQGVTAEGVVTEREQIQERQGWATVEASFNEIEQNPDDYPNIRGFYPGSVEEAWAIAAKESIRTAYKSIVIIRERPEPGSDVPKKIEIRYLHALVGESGDREYQTLDVIRQDQKQLASLLRDLEYEASTYFRKFQNVMAEIREAVTGS